MYHFLLVQLKRNSLLYYVTHYDNLPSTGGHTET